jgi:nucleoside-diphosphate-sugar epimerase
MTKIAFIGATGMLGKPVATELLNAGFEVSALVRDPERSKRVLPEGIKLVKGDLKNSSDVDDFLKGKDMVYLSLSIKQNEPKNAWHSESEGMKIILAAAKKHNIKRIGYLSSLVMFYQGMNGFKWWVFDIKHKAVEMIRQSGIPYSIFYPSNFMESLDGMYRSGNRMLLAGTSQAPMYFIAANDYGKQVAVALKNNNGNKEYYIQGPEPFIADDAVKEFVKHYPKGKLSISKAPLGIIRFFGLFNTRMNYGGHILEALNNYPEKFMAQTTWEELGIPSTTIQKFAQSCK